MRRLCRASAWFGITAALLLTGGAARAADDAGTQSVFAVGAGNRALAMGSAFVAAADDASAVIWNPAGLGWVQRSELQVTQAGDMGLGFHEAYAAIAFPSWRWGTPALSFRTFGVGGIEQRDARNVLLGEISDREIEMAVAYGRCWGPAFSVGGAVKLQRQTLAGLSGSGLGVDLGVQVHPAAALGISAPWASGWVYALAVRNAIGPTLRLDRESVTDPASVRSGLAWRSERPGLGSLLAELDLEKTRGVDAHLRAGLEYRPHPSLALRMGSDGRGLSAGSGFRWRDLALDYAFQDSPIASEHRVGVSLQFGASADESRAAARRKEDEALQRRLAEAFQERQARQVAELVQRAEEAHGHGLYDDALEALAVVLTLEPKHAAATTLEVACLKGKAGALERAGELVTAAMTYDLAVAEAPRDSVAIAGSARCRAESDRRAARTAQARERFGRAMEAFASDDLVRARTLFATILAEVPSDGEAVTMLSRTEQAIGRRAQALIDQANRSLRAGRPAEAEPLLDRAAALDPAAPGLAQASAALARASRPPGSATGETATRAPTSPDPLERVPRPRLGDREIEQLYRQGLAAQGQGRPDDAMRYWELVWSSRPGYREVNEFLKREYLTRGIEAFASGRLDEAVTHWNKVLQVDPSDERARGYLARAQKQMARSREILGENR